MSIWPLLWNCSRNALGSSCWVRRSRHVYWYDLEFDLEIVPQCSTIPSRILSVESKSLSSLRGLRCTTRWNQVFCRFTHHKQGQWSNLNVLKITFFIAQIRNSLSEPRKKCHPTYDVVVNANHEEVIEAARARGAVMVDFISRCISKW